MASPVALPKNVIIFGVVVPLALLLGILVADPFDKTSLAVGALILGALVTPVLLRWHHPMLITAWNSGMIVFLLPGLPQLWMCLAGISLVLTALHCQLDKQKKFINVPGLSWALIIFGVVVLVTAEMTGGIGVRALGGNTYGGKKYYFMLFAILGYFALSGHRIPKEKAQLYVSLFFLSSIALALSNVVFEAGPAFYWLYLFFPMDYAVNQAMEEVAMTTKFNRLSGLTAACIAVFSFLHMRYGIRGIFNLKHWWRFLAWLCVIGLSLLGGFRSALIIFALLFLVQYLLEGLVWSRITLFFAGFGIVVAVTLMTVSDRLPLSMQRALSFLPIEVHPIARADAQASTDWRLRMWKVLLPDVPKYFWRGKGYTASPSDYYLAQESIKRGLAEDIEISLIAGDYHNGPLSVAIPFGVWGTAAFLLFLGISLKVLIRNLRYGDPDLRNINLFLLAVFIARIIGFMTVFGAISSDLALFCGLVGLSVSINNGAAKPLELPEESLEPVAA